MTPTDAVAALVEGVLRGVALTPGDLARLAAAGEADRAVALAEARPPDDAAAALAAVARATAGAGQAGQAHDLVGRALAATPGARHGRDLLVTCAEAEALAGDVGAAGRLVVEAWARCGPWAAHRGEGVEVASRHALALHKGGAAQEAHAVAADAEDRARAVASRGWRDDALARIAGVWAMLGAPHRAAQLVDEVDDPWPRVEALIHLGWSPATPADVASTAVDRAGEEAARIGYDAWRSEALGTVAVAWERRGEPERAEAVAATLADPVWAAETWIALAAAAVARGDAVGSARRVGRGRDAARRCDYGWWHRRGEALKRLAHARAATGEPVAARAVSDWSKTSQVRAAVALGLAEGYSAATQRGAPPPADEVGHVVALIESLAPDPARAAAAIALLDLRSRPGEDRS